MKPPCSIRCRKRQRDNDRLADRKRKRADFQASIDADQRRFTGLTENIAEHEAELAHMREQRDALTKIIEEAREKLANAPALPEPIDVSDLREQLNAARQHNAAGARAAEKATLLAAAEYNEGQVAELTASMEAREAAKTEAIAAAKLPVDGITFGEGEVLLNGVPFDQGSDAEQLRASIAIAMASDSRLRVIRVRDGSLLDASGMALLSDMARERDYQVWVEQVSDGGSVGFVIEDGSVKSPKKATADA